MIGWPDNEASKMAVERPAGSHSLAGAAHRRRSTDSYFAEATSGGEYRAGRRALLFIITLGVLLGSLAAQAQQSSNVYRIGFLGNSTAVLEANLVGPFREGLRDLGYVEGRNVLIEYRWAEGKYDRFPALIGELLALKVAVIVTAGTPATLAVKKAATSVPLVMAAIGDPVGTGIIPSLSHPGGNITGLTAIST